MIYRPPNTDLSQFNNEFENVIKSLTKTKTNLILAGDYNINLLNHELYSETGIFLNILFANAMVPTITRPTRYGEHCATLIDNILTNIVISSDSKRLSGIILEGISDPLPVFFLTAEVEITKDPIFYQKNFREINEATLSDFQK